MGLIWFWIKVFGLAFIMISSFICYVGYMMVCVDNGFTVKDVLTTIMFLLIAVVAFWQKEIEK